MPRIALVPLFVGIIAVAACESGSRPAASNGTAETPAWLYSGERAQALTRASRNVVSFLRDSVPFDSITVADSVVLLLSPEGGGDSVSVAREQLRDRANWRIPAADGGTTYSLVPPQRATVMTTALGRHFNCHEYPLASRYPALADLPHVGVRLQPRGVESCLQAWNLTLVFGRDGPEPVLRAAVYDQWEW